ncbi:MAG: hypothetical protein JXR83_09445 [Deltaproteobacteria bacterium]|nr:hypothetical protein [Deltaproteobacteria bacterium]
MTQDAIGERLRHLLDTRWRPQLRLTTSERDNLIRWDGSGRDHFEVYAVGVPFPEQQAALWLRHEVRFAHGHKIAPHLRVAAMVFDFASGEHRVFSETFALADLDVGRKRFSLGLGPVELTHARARGHLQSGALRWDLSWEPRHVTNRSLLFSSLYDSPLVPTKVLVPNDAVPMWGTVQIGDRLLEAAGVSGQQAHLWGRRHPQRYMWTRVLGFEHRPDCRFEAAQVQDWIGDRPSPWLLAMRITYQHHPHVFVRLVPNLVKARTQHYLAGWSFSSGRRHLYFRGRIDAEPAQFVGSRVEDPDGREHLLATTAGASCQLEVLRRRNMRFQREALLTATGQTWYEISGHAEDPDVPTRL